MIASVFLNFVYLFFPVCVYFIYLVYSKVTYEKEKLIFFDLALFTSFYFCSRFGDLNKFSTFLINVPFLLAMHKKRIIPSLLLLFGTSFFLSDIYDVNVFVFIAGYALIYILGFFSKFKIINIFMLFNVIFGILIAIFIPNHIVNVKVLGYMVMFWLVSYLLFYFIILFYDKIDTIIKMYSSLEEITKEKKLYESLFKITHEIKNPLAVCKGYLDMFDVNNPAKANKYASIINQEIDRTLLLLKDFSDVSKLNIEKNTMDINMLLEDVCDESKLILKNNIDFKYEINSNEIYINGDYNRLKQVLINVIKNAKEAIEEEGSVELNTKISKNKYIITISDTGVGMDKETSKKIGSAFYTTKKNGTGLGVCFSREIIEKHGGTMEYFSKPEKGTTVKIVLPINKAST